MVKTQNSHLNTFIRYLIPCVFGMLVISAYAFTDTFVVGRELGDVGLAAMGIGTPILTSLFAIGYLFGEGGGATYSILKGQGKIEEANKIYTYSLILSIIVGLLTILFGNLFIYQISTFLGATSSNIEYTVEYLRWILVFAPFIILNITLNNFVRNSGAVNVAMSAVVIGSVVNIILDFVFVFVLHWGMQGASIATCIGNVISVLINFAYTLINRNDLILTKTKIDFKDILRILKNGFAPFLLSISVALLMFFFNFAAQKHYGTIGISTYTIIQNWNFVVCNLIIGIAQAMQPLISLNTGKKDYVAVKKYRKYGYISAVIIGLICIPIWIIFPEHLSAVFIDNNKELLNLCIFALRVSSVYYLFYGINIITGYYYAATENPKNSIIINMARGCVFPLICVFVFPLIVGNAGVWYSVPLAEGLTMILAISLMAYTIIKEKKSQENEK